MFVFYTFMLHRTCCIDLPKLVFFLLSSTWTMFELFLESKGMRAYVYVIAITPPECNDYYVNAHLF